MKTFLHSILLALVFILGLNKLNAQGINTPFGQNRIQYHRFDWSFLRTENFDAFFYSGGRELANYSVRYAEQNLAELEKLVDHRLAARVEIICYNTLSDLKQSNFGLEEMAQNTGGFTNVVNNRIYVYFNGDHAHLNAQIKDGLSLVLLNELLYGGSLPDRVQNAALLNLPEWFLRGLTSYLSRPWTSEMDNQLKDYFLSKKSIRFNKLSQRSPVFAGHSMWKFLSEKFEPGMVSQLIYYTKLTRNYESAFLYETNLNFHEIQKEWYTYYKELYSKEESSRTLPENQLKIKRRIAQYLEPVMRVSSKGNYVSFTSNKNGKFKVWLMDTKTGKIKKVFKGGLKYNQLEIDRSFPLIAWQAGGDKMAYIYEHKSEVYLCMLDLINKKTEKIRFLKFDKITGIDFSDNGRTIVLSAIRKGQSDIFTYDIPTRKEKQLTFDFWDDINPRFSDYSTKILFSSNRKRDSLGVGNRTELDASNNYDVFQYDLETGSPKLKRLSKTPFINETQAQQYTKDYYTYLSDYNGIKNRYAARIEEEYDFTELLLQYPDSMEKEPDTLIYKETAPWSGTEFTYNNKEFKLSNYEQIDTIIHYKDIIYTYPQTNYHRNILAFDIARQTGILYELVLYQGKYSIRSTKINQDIEGESKQIETYPNMFRLKTGVTNKPFVSGRAEFKDQAEPEGDQNQSSTGEIKIPVDTTAYFFVNEFTPEDYKRPAYILVNKGGNEKGEKKNVRVAAPRFYDVTFFADKVITQVDNSIINTYYQPISPVAGQLFNPGLNGMFKLGMVDLFEDYRLVGGVRLAFDLQGFDYFASFETLRKRIDHKLMFYRQTRSGGTSENLSFKNYSHEIRYILGAPINPANGFKLHFFLRQDRDIIRSTNPFTLEFPDIVRNWAGAKLEYIYDNTIPKGLNLWNGSRMKIFYEHYRSLNIPDLQMNVLGIDARHYEKIHRQIIWASRFSANTSFGPGKVVYYLGGVENWISPRFNNDISTATDQNYIFQALACNMRGFEQNIRNGNTFAVMSTEIRFPVFQYAFNRTLRSEFLNHFQLVPFFDLGTAWVGSNPYSENNTFNQKTFDKPPVKIKVINVRDPLVAGVGGGLRTKLLGYFVRFDTAWGIQDAEINKDPVYHFSLGLDF
ncbi:MAG: hypothetical protein LCH37_01060 [Bacteroidetes bacterium]|nr:hypothetical protein [Bacteroidota bacterium]